VINALAGKVPNMIGGSADLAGAKVVGVALFMALLYSGANLVVDLLYAYLNPKIRYV